MCGCRYTMRMFRHLFMLDSRFPFRSVSSLLCFFFYCRLSCDCQMKSNSNSTENNQSHISKNGERYVLFYHTLAERQKNTSKRSTTYTHQTIPFECNKNEIANAYGAYNLCHLSLLYTQYFLSIYDSLRYKIESNKRSGKQQFSILVSVKMKGETRKKTITI